VIFIAQFTARVSVFLHHAFTPGCSRSRHPRRFDGLASEKNSATLHFFSEQALKLCLRIWGDSSKNVTPFLKKSRQLEVTPTLEKQGILEPYFYRVGVAY
jgi:hypothetical protein